MLNTIFFSFCLWMLSFIQIINFQEFKSTFVSLSNRVYRCLQLISIYSTKCLSTGRYFAEKMNISLDSETRLTLLEDIMVHQSLILVYYSFKNSSVIRCLRVFFCILSAAFFPKSKMSIFAFKAELVFLES